MRYRVAVAGQVVLWAAPTWVGVLNVGIVGGFLALWIAFGLRP